VQLYIKQTKNFTPQWSYTRSAFKLLDLCLSGVARRKLRSQGFHVVLINKKKRDWEMNIFASKLIAYYICGIHKYSNQCSCTSNKQKTLPHSDHTLNLAISFLFVLIFSPLLFLIIGPEGFSPMDDISRGLMTRAIWKRPCINLFITYFARADNNSNTYSCLSAVDRGFELR
jgi:hypothetical protein